MAFLDTNVLFYAASSKPGDAAKAEIARGLIEQGGHSVSLQVLQEFYNAARHPRKLALVHDEAVRFCSKWRKMPVLEPTLALFDNALAICDRYQTSYYDAAILAAARLMDCPVVYSEDLNDGQDYGGVKVVNPFRGL